MVIIFTRDHLLKIKVQADFHPVDVLYVLKKIKKKEKELLDCERNSNLEQSLMIESLQELNKLTQTLAKTHCRDCTGSLNFY